MIDLSYPRKIPDLHAKETMGSCVSLWAESRVLLFGLDGSGKTSILHKLKWGCTPNFLSPTGGYNVEAIKLGKHNFSVWDVGGHPTLRTVWQYHYPYAHGLVFVIDGADLHRLDEGLSELYRAVSDSVARKHVNAMLILLNKQDIPRCITAEALEARFDKKVMGNVNYCVQECTTVGRSNRDLCRGFSWLGAQIENNARLLVQNGQGFSKKSADHTATGHAALVASSAQVTMSSCSNDGCVTSDARKIANRALSAGVAEASSLLRCRKVHTRS
eukprot:m.1639905 g.1639905  ORF g.1639905 m.1639905 type:complete len:273 (+) comp38702_c0_seq1:480-1298(+)